MRDGVYRMRVTWLIVYTLSLVPRRTSGCANKLPAIILACRRPSWCMAWIPALRHWLRRLISTRPTLSQRTRSYWIIQSTKSSRSWLTAREWRRSSGCPAYALTSSCCIRIAWNIQHNRLTKAGPVFGQLQQLRKDYRDNSSHCLKRYLWSPMVGPIYRSKLRGHKLGMSNPNQSSTKSSQIAASRFGN